MARIKPEILRITQSLQEIVDADYAGNAAELARALGENESTFSRILNGFSEKGAERVVRKLVNMGRSEAAIRTGRLVAHTSAHDQNMSGENPPRELGKYTVAEIGEKTHAGDKFDAVVVKGFDKEMLKRILNIVAQKVPEGAMDVLINDRGGVYEVRVTDLVSEIDGVLRNVELVARISNALRKDGGGYAPPQEQKQEPPISKS